MSLLQETSSENGKSQSVKSPQVSKKLHKSETIFLDFCLPIVTLDCKKLKCHLKIYVPYAILSISILQIFCYMTLNENFQKMLRFEPKKMHEFWRFTTYMLLHEDCIHLSLNIFMQILFAYFLEFRHHRIFIIVLYLLGGTTAVLGASCFHPDLVIGASGGVYALLISHLADVVMNFEDFDHKLCRFSCILTIVVADIVYNVIHFHTKQDPIISWETHAIGGTSGFLLGLPFLKKGNQATTYKRSLFWTGLILYGILLSSLIILTVQIKRCTPVNMVQRHYTYFC